MPDDQGYISDREHWATFAQQPRPVQKRMIAAERVRRLRDEAAEHADQDSTST